MFTVLQNIALSFTLEVDPIDPRRAAAGHGAGARSGTRRRQTSTSPPAGAAPDAHMRIHLARALALGPRLLIAEHPSANLPRETVAAFGADLARLARSRGLALAGVDRRR